MFCFPSWQTSPSSVVIMSLKMRLGFSPPPPRLVHQCVESIFNWISLHIANHGFKSALTSLAPFLSQLPRELQTLLVKMAEKNLDHTYTVRTLLTIWWSCIDNGDSTEVATPRYLYNDEEGRRWILKKLGQFQNTEGVHQLAFFMYSFYNHLSSKIGQKGPDFYFEDDQLQDPRLMLDNVEQEMLCQVLSHFSHISTLILPTIANSSLLEVAAMNLTHLRTLDISCSTNVTDFGLMSLVGTSSRCKDSLEQLYMEGTSATTDGIFVLLANLPRLEVLESTLLERALDLIDNKSLNLRKITVGRFWRGNDVLKNLSRLCPHLCQIILPNLSEEQCAFMVSFQSIRTLKHVHIGQVKITAFLPVLAVIGPQLTTLTYSNFAESVDCSRIINSCLNLECLGINAGSVIWETTVSNMPDKLSEIRLNVHAFIAQKVWTMIFTKCHDLVYIDMTPAQELTDENLLEVLGSNRKALSEVRSFIVRGRHRGGDVRLTEKSINALLSRCEHLKCVGDCSTWTLLNPSTKEFHYFV